MEKKEKFIYRFVCFALLIIVLLLLWQGKVERTDKFKNSTEAAVLTTIHNRKSVRHFVPQKPVGKDELITLVKAGMAAPSAMNLQPWAFIAITERATLDSLGKDYPNASMLKDAGAAIVVCCDMKKIEASGDKAAAGTQFWVQDCSAASENILLAAEAMGLGAVWTGIYPVQPLENIRKTLGLPEHMIPLNIIPIGHPTGVDAPKNKWNEEKFRWEKWQ